MFVGEKRKRILLDDEKRIKEVKRKILRMIIITSVMWLLLSIFIFYVLLINSTGVLRAVYLALVLSFLGLGFLVFVMIAVYFYLHYVERGTSPVVERMIRSRKMTDDDVLGVKVTDLVMVLWWRCQDRKEYWYSVWFLCKSNKDHLLKLCKRIRVRRSFFDKISYHIDELNKKYEKHKILMVELTDEALCKMEQKEKKVQPVLLTLLGISFIFLLCANDILLKFLAILWLLFLFFMIVASENRAIRRMMRRINETVFSKNEKER